MGPIWVLLALDGPMLAPWTFISGYMTEQYIDEAKIKPLW